MRRALLFGFVVALTASLAAPAAGQGCVIVDIAETGYARNLAGPGGTNILFVSGPVEIHCNNGEVVVRADSAHNTGRELRLIRDVFYQDSVQTLTSETATYQRDIGRVIARGDVVVRDREGPSVVRGTELQYDRVTPTRPEALIVVRGRPRAYLYEEGAPPLPEGMEPAPVVRVIGADTIPAALQVDADRLELRGESRILAHGRVQIIRDDVRAFADAADYDRPGGRLDLTGSARIEGEGFELFGDRIASTLVDEELDHVRSEGDAQLVGEDLNVRAPVIDIALTGGDVDRMIAVSHEPGVQASTIAQDFTLIADSIQVDAPASVLDRLVAVGDAFGERAVDSTSAGLPELVRTDWLRGDTIVGTFIQLVADSAALAAGDTTETTLSTLTATGTARALYRMDAASDATDPAVNYITATQIALRFDAGEVETVDTVGPVEGVHLEPAREASAQPAAPPAGDGDGATTSRTPGGTR